MTSDKKPKKGKRKQMSSDPATLSEQDTFIRTALHEFAKDSNDLDIGGYGTLLLEKSRQIVNRSAKKNGARALMVFWHHVLNPDEPRDATTAAMIVAFEQLRPEQIDEVFRHRLLEKARVTIETAEELIFAGIASALGMYL